MTAEVARVTFEPINEKYSNARYGEFDVIMDMTTGYINATKLCAQGGKLMKNWLSNDSSKELMKELEETINLSLENQTKISILVSCSSFGYIKGTYVHPDLIPHIACWVSTKFAIKVSKIINEWAQASQENKNRYWNDMCDSFNQSKDINQNESKESQIRNQTAIDEDGMIEVETPAGFIDVLTNSKVIEIKQEYNWKHALGQVKSYGFYYQTKEKWIYLFDCKYENKDVINNICHSEGVFVKYLE
jgi:hypothetical protein